LRKRHHGEKHRKRERPLEHDNIFSKKALRI